MIIAVDFDGTLVKHEFPLIGEEVPHAFDTLRWLLSQGHDLILWTVRIGNPLKDAVEYCERAHGIPFYGINENPTQKFWNGSPKAYAPLYIDDAALGCPLIHGQHHRPFVDWMRVRSLLETVFSEQNFLEKETKEIGQRFKGALV